MEGIIKPYFYAACGAVGFALSFIIGLFSGAGLALVLIRALAFAVFFAMLSCCLHLVLMRFVPDLIEEVQRLSKLDLESSSPGLDITIEDDDSAIPDFLQDIAERAEVDDLVYSEEEVGQAQALDNEDEAGVSLNMGSSDEDEAIDTLPDMSEADDSTSMPGNADDLVLSTSLDTSELFDDAGGETMARAIRTVLSRE